MATGAARGPANHSPGAPPMRPSLPYRRPGVTSADVDRLRLSRGTGRTAWEQVPTIHGGMLTYRADIGNLHYAPLFTLIIRETDRHEHSQTEINVRRKCHAFLST